MFDQEVICQNIGSSRSVIAAEGTSNAAFGDQDMPCVSLVPRCWSCDQCIGTRLALYGLV